jgi:hypothetical protein
MEDKRKEDIEIQEELHSDASPATSQIELERPRSGLKLRTHIKAGAQVRCLDGEDM